MIFFNRRIAPERNTAPIEPTNLNAGTRNNSPLNAYTPYGILLLLTTYSPIIIVASIVLVTLVSQNFNGIIYLSYLIASLLFRTFIYYIIPGSKPVVNDGTVCTSIVYSPYGNATFSIFVFIFTLCYLFVPMYLFGTINYWLFAVLIFYCILDIGIKAHLGCYKNEDIQIFVNALAGGFMALSIVLAMSSNSTASQYLINNVLNSNKDICTMPSKQTFKCNVYKNGDLIGSV